MNEKITAVLINVTGIQQFIFHSNKLKENIGASYIIENEIYGVVMKSILQSTFGADFNIDLWKTDHKVKITENENILCEVGYIGGGNTLLLFRKKEKATNFIEAFSKKVLEMYPSLQLVFGLTEDFDLSEGKYESSYKDLMANLKQRKSSYIPLTTIPKHGITADCPWSNDSAEELYQPEKKEGTYISKASNARIKRANMKKYECMNNSQFELTTEIEHLGQEQESSYIAVVHIDGNGMGKIFSRIKELDKLREKSNAVSTLAETAMEKLLQDIIDKGKSENPNENGRIEDLTFRDYKYLPIRPILVGGDDITFICEGRLGMYLAEKFIEYFYNADEQKKVANANALIETGMTAEEAEEKEKVLMYGACSGVAIVKTHFPFYKAVQLAEELCAEAKKASRTTKGSYISYYYSATTFSGSLKQLRERTHRTPEGKNMYFGPYRLFVPKEKYLSPNLDDKEFPDAEKAIERLKEGIKVFKNLDGIDKKGNPRKGKDENGRDKYPKNKVMALRDAIIASPSAQKLFVKELKEQLGHKEEIVIWNREEKTEYFDQIELMDFYLPSLL